VFDPPDHTLNLIKEKRKYDREAAKSLVDVSQRLAAIKRAFDRNTESQTDQQTMLDSKPRLRKISLKADLITGTVVQSTELSRFKQTMLPAPTRNPYLDRSNQDYVKHFE